MKLLQKLKFRYRHFLNKNYGKQGFETLNYKGVPIERDAVQPRGHIVKAKPAKYNPDQTRRGGRIVKAMPRQLRQMKEAQEREVDPSMPFLPKE